ncbi:MAG: ACP S-malonyltransferase [Clostridiales Family XIII bacterium]|jgi:[acyl-carrier-protein] S-malonyltransferase|nr:ACP S-malonyltransferase [Clostridiales Family XIII bacterium]
MSERIRLAIIFAGQGAQKQGMGKSLAGASAAARDVFDRAGEEIRYDCFEADADRLKETEVTQPAVYTMDYAAYAALLEACGEKLPRILGTAGFSLGEYAAFAAAGVIGSFEEGLELVKKRGLLMKAAGRYADGSPRGAMAAAMGDPAAAILLTEKARGDDVLEAVNFNSPAQTVVAGDAAAIERFRDLAKADKSLGVKAIPLPVSTAFHSPIMAPAAAGFAEVVSAYGFGRPKYKVYLNITGEGLDGGTADADVNDGEAAFSDTVRDVMTRQMKSPVRWQTTIENMARDGINTIVEAGPGRTLSGLAKKTVPELAVFHVEDAESLAEAAAYLREAE